MKVISTNILQILRIKCLHYWVQYLLTYPAYNIVRTPEWLLIIHNHQKSLVIPSSYPGPKLINPVGPPGSKKQS